jgi:hypothetical protein
MIQTPYDIKLPREQTARVARALRSLRALIEERPADGYMSPIFLAAIYDFAVIAYTAGILQEAIASLDVAQETLP